jgi:hypothetical protein
MCHAIAAVIYSIMCYLSLILKVSFSVTPTVLPKWDLCLGTKSCGLWKQWVWLLIYQKTYIIWSRKQWQSANIWKGTGIIIVCKLGLCMRFFSAKGFTHKQETLAWICYFSSLSSLMEHKLMVWNTPLNLLTTFCGP